FYGREAEVSAIIELFQRDTPRIAILGGGGMGKTSLARAVIHYPEISSRYDQRRLFVTCDTILTSVQLAGLIGEHLGLKPGKDLIRPVISHFSSGLPSLLVLDNLETIWEPIQSRGEVEKFLSLLADIHQLAMVITMRGAERPANVRWTRPFLEPLKPLPQDAARETFITIADDRHSTEDIDKILRLTDNMPLAIDLIAHLVHYEGVARVLGRWETEKTSLLSDGSGKGYNLDFSLSLSLESSRLTALPQSRDLLSLLSILPDGLSDVELIQSKLPIENILACKAVLLRTALSYMDDQRRLKALVPIREYMKKIHPPTGHLVQPLLKHFTMLLTIYDTYVGTVSGAGVVA
ncbi:P-loop containing nucleoside triphosphate hydrolase protein, partial [Mycena vulgaris]